MTLTAVRPKKEAQDNDLFQLKARLINEGLFEKHPLRYCLVIAAIVALYSLSVALLFLTDSILVSALVAVLLTFLILQVGFIGHDAGHRQIWNKAWHNDLTMLLHIPFMGGSPSWWKDTHNAHHADPNDLEKDPHTQIPLFALSREKFVEKGRLARFVTRFQAYYFIPMLSFQGIGFKLASILYVANGKAKYRLYEALGIASYFAIYVAILVLTMSFWEAVVFTVINQTLTGLYMGSVFAPNHKGMMLLEPGNSFTPLERQVLTTRNLRPNLVVDILYGGLNYQIEHHLFSNLSRFELGKARRIVKAFCEERGVHYHETGIWESWKEILGSLDRIGRGV